MLNGPRTTVRDLVFCVHTLCMSYVIKTFVLVSSSVSGKCFLQGQVQKENKNLQQT